MGAVVTSFDEVVCSRRSVRSYTAELVADDLLGEILDLARRAPSSLGLQPWHFVVVRAPAARQSLAATKNRFLLPGRRAEFRADFLADAPVVVVVCVDVDEAGPREVENGVLAAGFLLLAAAARGLAGVFLTASSPIDEGLADAVSAELLLPPSIRPVVLVPLGYPSSTPPPPELRDLRQRIHQETFRIADHA